ncbi:TetR family transcriptional regulator [Actinoplanes lobatus]|uniref:DNA-binding transcriptional regulator YbjK n=1 Tax=Actinoplanes lobatus TaxID=113568 RepID=A0A7W7HMI2_9ACTN|nr:TetR family transcriptional regulator [Actinoplanes lobatus]MBB4752992.1 DNA-binding transcriptional regulator YbjK [Actinoplanes lobatus]GGN87536.1 TetR family transcriptional regulator [Actinoplanes lobatus]GIE39599.1 TetR family transcriptional regulator [Actinoplanes lobatus]
MSDPAPTATARRTRRHDPHRRDRLIDAALQVIAQRGVAGASHREIARAADVPLGSMTYHFASLDEILAEAFTRHADGIARVFDERLTAARTRDEAVEAVVGLVAGDLLSPGHDLVLTVELYVAAARNPRLRAVTQAWMQRSRDALERHFDPTTAREVDALIEGLTLHSALSTEPMTPAQIRHAIERYLR